MDKNLIPRVPGRVKTRTPLGGDWFHLEKIPCYHRNSQRFKNRAAQLGRQRKIFVSNKQLPKGEKPTNRHCRDIGPQLRIQKVRLSSRTKVLSKYKGKMEPHALCKAGTKNSRIIHFQIPTLRMKQNSILENRNQTHFGLTRHCLKLVNPL